MTPRAPELLLPEHRRPRPSLERNPSSLSKRSLPVSSHSNEADDEQSFSDASFDMAAQPPPAYPGQDTRLTSDRELSGFYMYGWAAEVFVVCGIGSFIPVTLEQLARENGVLLHDPSTACHAALPATTPSITSITSTTSTTSTTPAISTPHHHQCVVTILGLRINTASFAMYTFSISVLIQALLIISMSGAADHGRFRKRFLLAFAFIGSTATMLFLPVGPSLYLLAALLAIVANTCFGASFVLLNSFLPLLVRFHPAVRYASSMDVDDDDEDDDYTNNNDYNNTNDYNNNDYNEYDDNDNPNDSDNDLLNANNINRDTANETPNNAADATTALLPRQSPLPDQTTPRAKPRSAPSYELALSTKISSYGIAIGYIAALLVQTLSILVVIAFRSSNFGLRLVLFIIGAWWFIFTIPSAMWLRPRPGPPLHIAEDTSNIRTALAYFIYSWKSLGRTATHARRLKDVLLFLAAWFLLSDSIATVSGTAVLFAKTTLGMSYAMLALINVIATLSGVLGAFTWSRLSHYLDLTPVQTILACIALFEAIPLYGLLGYLPPVQRLGFLGLQQQWEMYPLGAIYGFVLGGLSSYCRALFGELIPPGFEAAFYALYAITDKGSSIFGPAIVGAITDAYGEIRPAFWFLAVLIALPFPVMLLVDVPRGRAEAAGLAKTLQGDAVPRHSSVHDDDDDVDEEGEERGRGYTYL